MTSSPDSLHPFGNGVARLARAGITRAAEVWCHAPGEVLGERYRARSEVRDPSHLGVTSVSELVELAKRAQPRGRFPLLKVDTTRPLDMAAVPAWLNAELVTPSIA